MVARVLDKKIADRFSLTPFLPGEERISDSAKYRTIPINEIQQLMDESIKEEGKRSMNAGKLYDLGLDNGDRILAGYAPEKKDSFREVFPYFFKKEIGKNVKILENFLLINRSTLPNYRPSKEHRAARSRVYDSENWTN